MVASQLFAPLALLGCSLVQLSLAQSSGSFNFLVYNVAGLPAFLNDNGVPGDKDTNAGIIGSKLAEGDFNVVQMQEVIAPRDRKVSTG